MTVKRSSLLTRLCVVMLAVAALALFSGGAPVFAQSGDATDSVFNWTDVPQNQVIPLDSASFDEGGYQLYDTQGETIIVPFSHHNLYVMQFARSQDATMYFVNSNGNVPILYVPRHAYLSNATVPGARWYPFPRNFNPPSPVYIGIAPDWATFTSMGWYSTMYYRGGYYGATSFGGGGVFIAIPGLVFQIGGQRYVGWDSYRNYYGGHGGWAHPGYADRTIYKTIKQPNRGVTWGQGRGGSGQAQRPVYNSQIRGNGWHSSGNNQPSAPARTFMGGNSGWHSSGTPQAPQAQRNQPSAPTRGFQGGNRGAQSSSPSIGRPSGGQSHGGDNRGGQQGGNDRR